MQYIGSKAKVKLVNTTNDRNAEICRYQRGQAQGLGDNQDMPVTN